MSASYVWLPSTPPPPIQGSIGLDMVDLLKIHYLDPTGTSIDRSQLHELEMTGALIPWLWGVHDVAVHAGFDELRDDAEQLMEGITKHGSIRLEVQR